MDSKSGPEGVYLRGSSLYWGGGHGPSLPMPMHVAWNWQFTYKAKEVDCWNFLNLEQFNCSLNFGPDICLCLCEEGGRSVNPLTGQDTFYNFILANTRWFYSPRGWALILNQLKDYWEHHELQLMNNFVWKEDINSLWGRTCPLDE